MSHEAKLNKFLFEDPNVGPLSPQAEAALRFVAGLGEEVQWVLTGKKPRKGTIKKIGNAPKSDLDKLAHALESWKRKKARVDYFAGGYDAVEENPKFWWLFREKVVSAAPWENAARQHMLYDGLSRDLAQEKLNPQSRRVMRLALAIVAGIKAEIEKQNEAVLRTEDADLF